MKLVLFTLLMGLILVIAASTWAASDPDLVIYYSFDKFATSVPDLSGKGYDATVVGDVKPDAGGKRGGAAKFTKTDAGSYLDVPVPKMKPADIPSDAISICAWLKGAELADLEIFSPRSGTVSYHTELKPTGTVRWLVRDSANTTLFEINTGKWVVNEWIHFAATYSAADKKGILYLNGELVEAKDATAGKGHDWSAGARFGMTVDNVRPFVGLMDDACILKRALKQDEIKIIMASGPPTPSPVSSEGSLTTTWGNIKN
jgi:hypothetical protein